MPSNVDDRDTFIRNLRLSASWRVLFAFAIHPALSALYFGYSVYYQTDDGFLSRRLQILLPLWYNILISGVVLPLIVKEHEEKRLRTLGYEQRRSRPDQVQWVLCVGVCLGCTYWLHRQDIQGWSVSSQFSAAAIKGLLLWAGVTLFMLGPIWWSTKRVR